jgi:predicted dehydrogenase
VQLVEGVEISAVGARDLARAREAAETWGISLAFGSYTELIASEAVDAVYIGTPAALHRQWSIAAIEAGKHVLCEKPFAANAADARLIAVAAHASDVVVMEAFHWRYHPYARHIRGVLDSGVLGRVERIEASFGIPNGSIPLDDIRFDLSLGGGAMMDLGSYPVQWVRFAARAEPEVVSAEAVCSLPDVDGSLEAELRWPSGVTGSVHASMLHDGDEYEVWLRVVGEHGTMLAANPLAPQAGGATITLESLETTRKIDADRSTTYYHQLWRSGKQSNMAHCSRPPLTTPSATCRSSTRAIAPPASNRVHRRRNDVVSTEWHEWSRRDNRPGNNARSPVRPGLERVGSAERVRQPASRGG